MSAHGSCCFSPTTGAYFSRQLLLGAVGAEGGRGNEQHREARGKEYVASVHSPMLWAPSTPLVRASARLAGSACEVLAGAVRSEQEVQHEGVQAGDEDDGEHDDLGGAECVDDRDGETHRGEND